MRGVSVEIMGQNLVIASDAGDDWVRAVAETVEEKIKDIRAAGQTVNSINLAILAALNFADELGRLRERHGQLIARLEAMNQRLCSAIEGVETK